VGNCSHTEILRCFRRKPPAPRGLLLVFTKTRIWMPRPEGRGSLLEPISKLKADVMNEYRVELLRNRHAYFQPNSIVSCAYGYAVKHRSSRKSILR
jgi:hypothetical protein